MKFFFVAICVTSIALFSLASAESRFGGALLLKAEKKDNIVENPSFKVSVAKGVYKILCKKKGGEFHYESSAYLLKDLVFSEDGKTLLLLFKVQKSSRSSEHRLVFLEKDGVLKVLNYSGRNIGDVATWIIELGSVSNRGTTILAKLARFRESESAYKSVEHYWGALSFSDGSVSVVKFLDLNDAISKWNNQNNQVRKAE